jgi:hypothetical protein
VGGGVRERVGERERERVYWKLSLPRHILWFLSYGISYVCMCVFVHMYICNMYSSITCIHVHVLCTVLALSYCISYRMVYGKQIYHVCVCVCVRACVRACIFLSVTCIHVHGDVYIYTALALSYRISYRIEYAAWIYHVCVCVCVCVCARTSARIKAVARGKMGGEREKEFIGNFIRRILHNGGIHEPLIRASPASTGSASFSQYTRIFVYCTYAPYLRPIPTPHTYAPYLCPRVPTDPRSAAGSCRDT